MTKKDTDPTGAKWLMEIDKKNFLLKRRNIWQNRAQGGAAICQENLGVMGGRQDKRHSMRKESEIINN